MARKFFTGVDVLTNSLVRFYNTADTFAVSVKCPAAQAANFALVLPGTDTTNGAVVSNGSGVLSISLIVNANVAAAAAIAVNKLAALTASRAVVSDASGFLTQATTTAAEIGFVNGVTSAIQTQLDAKLAATQIITISSNTTLTNKAIHFVDTSAARSLTLPSPTVTSYIVVKDKIGTADTNNITIVRAAAEKIETVAASYVLNSALGSWTFASDGTDWFII